MHKIRVFCSGIFSLSPSGILKMPRATRWALGPPFGASRLSPALGPGGVHSGIFKIPSGLGGIWAKIPSAKSEFSIQISFLDELPSKLGIISLQFLSELPTKVVQLASKGEMYV